MRKLFVLSAICLQSLALANPLPFSGPLLNGQPNAVYQSADHQDALFVLVFTCDDLDVTSRACSYNEKAENQLATKYANEPRVQILDIADLNDDESPDGMLKFIAANQVNHPVVVDRGGHLLSQFLQLGFLEAAFPPFTYVVSPDGKVLLSSRQMWEAQTFDDPNSTLSQAIEKLIQQHLAQH
jgi:hypothetical protein